MSPLKPLNVATLNFADALVISKAGICDGVPSTEVYLCLSLEKKSTMLQPWYLKFQMLILLTNTTSISQQTYNVEATVKYG